MRHLLLITSILWGLFSFSQENEKRSNFDHYLGLQFGPTTGIGLSYSFFKGKTGLRSTAIGYKRASLIDLNGGLTLIHKLVEGDKVDFISYVASRVTYKQENVLHYNENTEDVDVLNPQEMRVNASLGLGMNARIGEYFEISTQLGYALFNINNQRSIIYKNRFHYLMNHPENPWNMVTASVGIHYKINRK